MKPKNDAVSGPSRCITHAHVKYVGENCTHGNKHVARNIIKVNLIESFDENRLGARAYRVKCGNGTCRATVALVGTSAEDVRKQLEAKRPKYPSSKTTKNASDTSSAAENKKKKQSETDPERDWKRALIQTKLVNATTRKSRSVAAPKRHGSVSSGNVTDGKGENADSDQGDNNEPDSVKILTDSTTPVPDGYRTTDSGLASSCNDDDRSSRKSRSRLHGKSTGKGSQILAVTNTKHKRNLSTPNANQRSIGSHEDNGDPTKSSKAGGSAAAIDDRSLPKKKSKPDVKTPRTAIRPAKNLDLSITKVAKRGATYKNETPNVKDDGAAATRKSNIGNTVVTLSRSKTSIDGGHRETEKTSFVKPPTVTAKKLNLSGTVQNLQKRSSTSIKSNTRGKLHHVALPECSTTSANTARAREDESSKEESQSEFPLSDLDSDTTAGSIHTTNGRSLLLRYSNPMEVHGNVDDVPLDDNVSETDTMELSEREVREPILPRSNTTKKRTFDELLHALDCAAEADRKQNASALEGSTLTDKEKLATATARFNHQSAELLALRVLNYSLQRRLMISVDKMEATLVAIDFKARQNVKKRIEAGQDLPIGFRDEMTEQIHAGYGYWVPLEQYDSIRTKNRITTSRFVGHIARQIFTDETLRASSVTGQTSNLHKLDAHGNPRKPKDALCAEGLMAVYALTRYWLKSLPDMTEERITKEMSKASSHIAKKIADMNRPSRKGEMRRKRADMRKRLQTTAVQKESREPNNVETEENSDEVEASSVESSGDSQNDESTQDDPNTENDDTDVQNEERADTDNPEDVDSDVPEESVTDEADSVAEEEGELQSDTEFEEECNVQQNPETVTTADKVSTNEEEISEVETADKHNDERDENVMNYTAPEVIPKAAAFSDDEPAENQENSEPPVDTKRLRIRDKSPDTASDTSPVQHNKRQRLRDQIPDDGREKNE